jgi:methyl-accepting chemotaxis protein
VAHASGPPARRRRTDYGVVGGAGLVLLLLAAVAGATLSIVSLSRDQAELQDHNVPFAVAIATAALNAKGIANHERGFLISGDPEFLAEIDQDLLSVRTAFSEATITADTDDQRAAAGEAHAGFERWIWTLQRQLKLFQSGDRQSATKASLGRGRALRKDYEASLVHAQDVAARAIESRRNSFASSSWIFILLVCVLLVIAAGVGIALWLMRALEPRVEEPEAVGAPIAVFPTPARRSRGKFS